MKKWRSVTIMASVGVLMLVATMLAVANPVTANNLPATASYELQCEGEEVLLAVTVSNTSDAEEIYANARFESGSEMDVFIDTFIGPQQSVTESLAKLEGATGDFVLEVYDEDVQNMEVLFDETITFECEEPVEDPTEDPTEEPTEEQTVAWSGQGTDSIVECEAGQDPYIHWVLTSGGNSATFTSATLVVDDSKVGDFEQKGQGAWHLTTQMFDLESEIAAVLDGESGNAQLVIFDACMAEEPEPEPTETETEPEPEPTETETEELGPASQVEKEVPARDELPRTGLAETLLAVSLGLFITGGLMLFATRRRTSS